MHIKQYSHINPNFDAGHVLIPLFIVSCIYCSEKKKKQFSIVGPPWDGQHFVDLHHTASKIMSHLLTKDLIKNLVKPGHKRHISAIQSNILIVHPHLLKKVVN